MKVAKLIYKADLTGGCTVEQQIGEAEYELRTANKNSREFKFEIALRYEITRTVINILSNASIKYDAITTPFCESFQKKLIDIFFALHDFGMCFLEMDEDGRIIGVSQTKGSIQLIDKTHRITGVTQKSAAKKALELFGVITDAAYSVIDERGVIGMFSPQKDTVVKAGAIEKLYAQFRSLFGIKKGQRKFIVVEVPMTYSGVSIPVKDLELLENKRDSVSTVARIYGIGEDMIQGGSTYDNKENAIIQTYTDYKGLIYGWINQIESQLISFRNTENYDITFPGVPQLNKPAMAPAR